MDCTTTGAEEPTRTFPTLTVVDFLRSGCAIYPSVLVYNSGLRTGAGAS
jgi:hypothetical protein